jgi:2-succinyl-6-hydroxy-2,4-cyclohexadiene-1-carboxylate synthase
LSDANHAVRVAKELLGPVHLNIQFRENLAPEAGPIRGDSRIGSVTSFSTDRFTDVAGFQRWSGTGSKWTEAYYSVDSNIDTAVYDIGSLIARSNRGIIIVGNIRNDSVSCNSLSTAAIISDFAETIGFPLFVGAQSAHLRFLSDAVVPYADHLLKNQHINEALRPDLIIQFGTHIVSSEVLGLISHTMRSSSGTPHVLLHTERPAERVDSTGTITHQIDSPVETFIPMLTSFLQRTSGFSTGILGSDLCSLILLGRHLSEKMPDIIHESSQIVATQTKRVWESHGESFNYNLTEPQIILAMSEILSDLKGNPSSLFFSNSMPVRDAEFFLYPRHVQLAKMGPNLSTVAVNRGASGIDGIISSAIGFCEASSMPTTLLIGDLACIHDLNSFHNLAKQSTRYHSSPKKPLSLSTIIVNNDGGAIFSFLPIAKHGNDVNFEEFFGTPTKSFSFGKGAEAFGLAYSTASDYRIFKEMYKELIGSDDPSVLEAKVVSRDQNVQVHTEITRATNSFLDNLGLFEELNDLVLYHEVNLPAKIYKRGFCHGTMKRTKSLVLLHGWMGDKTEWDESAQILIQSLSDEWNVISIDLPGHGESPHLFSENDLMRGLFSSESERTHHWRYRHGSTEISSRRYY